MKIYNGIDRGVGNPGRLAGGAVPASGAADSQPTAPRISDPVIAELRRHFQSEHQRRAFRSWSTLVILAVAALLAAWVAAAIRNEEPSIALALALCGMAAFGTMAGLLVWQARK